MSIVNEEIKIDAKVLIISWSPVPTPKYQKIEGSGQRFFGLANGLKKNGIKDITIAVGTIYPLDVDEVSGIKLFNYDFDDAFVKKLSEYDTIIYNYAIHGSTFITMNLPKDAQVIFDIYGPAYIESLARDPQDLVGTYVGNLAAVNEVFNVILPRGDYFLYANDAQEKFYTGVLATLGVINQFSYKTDRLLKVPFGIDKPAIQKFDNPYLEYGIKENDFVLLWFGGLYPWFDITKILDTLKSSKNKKIKFVIVGGNNPQNQHPDFIKHYHNTVKYINEHNLDDQVVLIDWVDYATRRKYYEFANAIISMNGEGKENKYSWRTRVMDYVGSTTPLITNGGDPLSDELIEVGAAFKVDATSKTSIQTTIEDLVKSKAKLNAASKKMKAIQSKYYWETVTEELADKIKNQTKPFSDEQEFRNRNSIGASHTAAGIVTARPRRSVTNISRILVRKTREKGVKNTSIIVKDKVRRKLAFEYRKKFPKVIVEDPKIVIVSSQLNNTGAPFVIMDVVREIKKRQPLLIDKIKFIAFTPIEATNVEKLRKDGVEVEVYTNRELPLSLGKGDVVIFNTFAMSRSTVVSAIDSVNQGNASKIFWYGHEAAPDSFIDDDIKRSFKQLLNNNKAKVYSVSEQTKKEYDRFFGTSKNIEKMPFRFLFPSEKMRVRGAAEFDELRFITTGSLMDMRKGQYPILYAFLDFYHNFYTKNPSNYRQFHLEFIGAYEKSDLSLQAPYHIQNILKQLKASAEGLEGHFAMSASMSHEKAIEAISRANVTICYSLLEAMGIFVYEGMATGHPIIRNESAGQKEQLEPGKNGYAVSSEDFAGLVDVIEIMLNKSKTSNQDLAKMSKLSYEKAVEATVNDYFIVDEVAAVFKSYENQN